jgi:hypothetical protein
MLYVSIAFRVERGHIHPMTSLPTAKILFFIAMSLNPHPHGAHTVFATSNSDNYVWTGDGQTWALKTKGLPTEEWVEHNGHQFALSGDDTRAIARHNWSHDSALDLTNGNRIEKQGNAGFYIINPGAPNQKTFTILYPKDS